MAGFALELTVEPRARVNTAATGHEARPDWTVSYSWRPVTLVLGESRSSCPANWHHVGMLVATEIEVDSTTGMCVRLSMPLTRSASTAAGPFSPPPQRGIDAPMRSEAVDVAQKAVGPLVDPRHPSR